MVCFLQEVRLWTALRRISGAPGKPQADPAAAGGPAPCHAPERQQLGARKNRTGFADADRAGGGFFGTDAGSLLGEAGRPAYPRLQKRFVTGFVVCAGLLLAVSGLELGLFAYWRKLLLHDYSPALYAALWKLFVPPLHVVCFWTGRGVLFRDVVARPVRKTGEASASACGAGAGLAGACADGAVPCRCAGKPRRCARLACTAASKTCGKTCDSDHSAGFVRRLHRVLPVRKERLKWAFGFSCWQ